MATKDLRPSRNPYAGTVPHGDPGKEVQLPSSGPGERARQPIPGDTETNAANDQNGSPGPRGKRKDSKR
ncbi:MAG TPA: hypothetical protein VLV87_12190 [Gammaproteobacteria bacterium]|nr:hypothetical protein [Gammaproteobacteria bacterium]